MRTAVLRILRAERNDQLFGKTHRVSNDTSERVAGVRGRKAWSEGVAGKRGRKAHQPSWGNVFD